MYDIAAKVLTTMSILAGLVSKQLPTDLLAQRKDLMIESITYELIKREGRQEGLLEGRQTGLLEGRQTGLLEGRQEGRQEGIREGLLEAIASGLDLRFGAVGLRILPEIERIGDVSVLRALVHGLRSIKTPEELRVIYSAN